MGFPAGCVIGEVNEDLVCKICQELAEDAVILPCCSTQLFCRDCLQQWLSHSLTCPTHQGPTTRGEVSLLLLLSLFPPTTTITTTNNNTQA